MTDMVANPDVLLRRALKDSVQEFPEEASLWGVIPVSQRGPILPAYGTRDRDRALRKLYRHEYNTLVQGAFTGLTKKVTSAPWIVDGNKRQVEYFQTVLQEAQFGRGWKDFISRVLIQYLTQDAGAFVEIIGPGNPDGALTGAVTGLAALDSLRCYVTGNIEFPVLYQSAITGQLHKMHRTRIVRIVDMPDGEETMYGHGLCALSRAIAIVQREILMGRYVEMSLDDKPKPGILSISGATDKNIEKQLAAYTAKRSNDAGGDIFGQTAFLYGLDPANPLVVTPINFAQPPEKFDYTEYTNLNVNALALALGVDKQELWELTGNGLGSGTQSLILSQKAKGKAFGDILSTIERMLNIAVLPEPLEFKFQYRDDERDASQAELDAKYVDIAAQLKALGVPTDVCFQLLVNRSETFRDVMTDDSGNVVAPDDDQGVLDEQVVATDTTTAPDAQQHPAPEQAAAEQKAVKSYDATRREFVDNLVDLISSGNNDEISRRRFGIVFRAQLRRLGQKAFEDGLQAGGVTAAPGDDELVQVQAWLAGQSAFVTNFANEVFGKGLSEKQIEQRAEMWANKSLQDIYNEGVIAADRNGMYEWILGQTEEHCPDCQRLNGQRHRFKEWYVRSLTPKSMKLDCKGFNCECKLTRSDRPAYGRFLN